MSQDPPSVCITGTYHPNDERLLGLHNPRHPGQGLREIFLDEGFYPVRAYRLDKARGVLDSDKSNFDVLLVHMHEDADYEDARACKHMLRDTKSSAAKLLFVHPDNLKMDVTLEALEWVNYAILGPVASPQPLVESVRALAQYRRDRESKKLIYKVDQYPSWLEEAFLNRYLKEANTPSVPSMTFQTEYGYAFDSPPFVLVKQNLVLFTSVENYLELEPRNIDAKKFLLQNLLFSQREEPGLSLELLVRDRRS